MVCLGDPLHSKPFFPGGLVLRRVRKPDLCSVNINNRKRSDLRTPPQMCVFLYARASHASGAESESLYALQCSASLSYRSIKSINLGAPYRKNARFFFVFFFCFAIFSTLLKPGISTALTDDALACAACYARRRRLHTKQLGIRGKGSCTTSGIWWGSITERRQCLSRRQRLSPQFSRLPQQVSGAARKLQRACPKI